MNDQILDANSNTKVPFFLKPFFKYFAIPIIALGIALSAIVGIEYKCPSSGDIYSTFYASPFLFKQVSLGSSMEYYYSIVGLLLNFITWFLILITIRYLILKTLNTRSNPKTTNILYRTVVGGLLIFSILSILFAWTSFGQGFNENLNYWYWNLDQETVNSGITCKGQWYFL